MLHKMGFYFNQTLIYRQTSLIMTKKPDKQDMRQCHNPSLVIASDRRERGNLFISNEL
jgi:hypothetical protein